eukprot:401738-Hanusia_phi.AAC.1
MIVTRRWPGPGVRRSASRGESLTEQPGARRPDYPPVYTRVRRCVRGVLGPLGGVGQRYRTQPLENFRLAAAGTGTQDNWISPRQLVEPRAAES